MKQLAGFSLAVALVTLTWACGGGEAPPTSGPVLFGEDCNNGQDDDGDLLIDCQDPQCATSSACQPECGNGAREGDEACDLNDEDCEDGWVCSDDCHCVEPASPICGDGVRDDGEACDGDDLAGCDEGQTCGDDCGCVDPSPVCGDGLAEGDEDCDGDDDDTCDEDEICSDDCLCRPVLCGDGLTEGDEHCDGSDDDACDEDESCSDDCLCRPVICGDGIAEGDEHCDGEDLRGCLDDEECGTDCTCRPLVTCGDGIVAGDEACEEDDLSGCDEGASCVSCACVLPTCGNGILEGTEACEEGIWQCPAGESCALETCQCESFACGNDLREGSEVCDGSDDRFCDGLADCTAACACEAAACPLTYVDLNSVGTTDGAQWHLTAEMGRDDLYVGACGSNDPSGGELLVEFTAPQAGTYLMSTDNPGTDPALDTVLIVLAGCQPDAEALACGADMAGPDEVLSEVAVLLDGGDVVFIVIDGETPDDIARDVELSVVRTMDLTIAPVGEGCNGVDIICEEGLSCEEGACTSLCPTTALGPLTQVAEGRWEVTESLPGDIAVPGGIYEPLSSCTESLGGSWENTYAFTAPTSGRYRLSTNNGDTLADTILYLLGDCNPRPILSCNDDIDFLGREFVSELVVELVGGEAIVVVVDGWSSFDHGLPYELSIQRLEIGGEGESCDDVVGICDLGLACVSGECVSICPGLELNLLTADGGWADSGTLPGEFGQITGHYDPPSSCASALGSGDVSYRFWAPTEGTYTFATQLAVSDGKTVLYLLDGCGSDAETLACSGPSTSAFRAYVQRELVPDESVIVVVDGESPLQNDRPYELLGALTTTVGLGEDCTDIVAPCEAPLVCFSGVCAPSCPVASLNDFEATIEETYVVIATMPGIRKLESGVLEPPLDCSSSPGGAAELRLAFTAPESGTYVFSTAVEGTEADTVLYLLGDCASDVPVACNDDLDLEARVLGSTVMVDLTAGEEIVIAVDGWSSFSNSLPVELWAGRRREVGPSDACDGVVVLCSDGLSCVGSTCE